MFDIVFLQSISSSTKKRILIVQKFQTKAYIL